LSKNRVKLK